MSFYAQAFLFTVFSVLFLQRKTKLNAVSIAMSIAWLVGVSTIYWRYGAIGQLTFYQNDQKFHWWVVHDLIRTDFEFTFNRLNFFRAPYTFPAYVLSRLGFDVVLSLKFVSHVCAIGTYTTAQRFIRKNGLRIIPIHLLLLGLPITTFFSVLALRETMMMLCVTQVLLGQSPKARVASMVTLVLLRPHLAVALVLGIVWGILFTRPRFKAPLLITLTTALVPIYLGTFGYSIGVSVLQGLPLRLYQDLFLRDQIVQVFSGFFGLQFLTVPPETVEFGVATLFLLRLMFPEIILAPMLFALSCLLRTFKLDKLSITVLATFSFYMGVSTGTDFLSTRQNLPLMPAMGAIAILFFWSRVSKLQDTETLSKELAPQ